MKISVITINFNNDVGLAATIKSVLDQSYYNLDFIVIDGGSSDNSINIINANKKWISSWVSEKDLGIYDAMNKGINRASGDWVCFKNSGDLFYDNECLNKFYTNYRDEFSIDVIYGPSYLDYGFSVWENPDVRKLNFNLLFQGKVMPPHQSTFVRKDLFKNYRFPIEYKIASDYHFILTSYLSGRKFLFDQNCGSVFKVGGISTKNEFANVLEKYRITRLLMPKKNIYLNYGLLFAVVFLKSQFKRVPLFYRFFISVVKK